MSKIFPRKVKITRSHVGVFILAVLAFHLAAFFPWRLAALTLEALHAQPSHERLVKTNARYWEVLDLEAKLLSDGWPVEYQHGLMEREGAYGATVYKTRMCWGPMMCEEASEQKIVVDASLSWDERWSVLLHEAAHTRQPHRLTENQREVWAESIAALAAHDGLREHARYLAGLKPDILMTVLAYSSEMYRVAEDLTR